MTNLPSALPLLLSLLLLVPRLGLAAEEPAPESSRLPGTEQPVPLRLNPEEDSWAREPQRPSRGVRILAETGASLLTGAGGGLAGALTGNALCKPGPGGPLTFPCLNETGWGLVVGANLGFAVGTFWGGEATGGDGRLLGSLAGMASGTLLGLLLGAPSDNGMGLVLALPLGLIGSIVGYELTEHGGAAAPRASAAPDVASTRPRVQPMLAVSARGALLGLGGSF